MKFANDELICRPCPLKASIGQLKTAKASYDGLGCVAGHTSPSVGLYSA